MVCARWNNNCITVFDQMLFLSAENKGGFTLLDAKELINFRMHFISNLFAGL
jgi:hypothetical protein